MVLLSLSHVAVVLFLMNVVRASYLIVIQQLR
jgi:hypothetical protein